MSDDRATIRVTGRSALGCEQYWWLREGLGLTPSGRRPARVGRLWHVLMAAYSRAPVSHHAGRMDVAHAKLAELTDELSDREDQVDVVLLLAAMLRQYDRMGEREDSNGWVPLLVEERITVNVPTPRGHPSWVSLTGRLDVLIRDRRGQLWVWDHKSSTSNLLSWRDSHEYDPQAASYAWLVEQRMGERPVGVVFDVVLQQPEPLPDAYKVVKSGDRLYKTLPTGTTAHSLLAAIRYHGFHVDDVPWYGEAVEQLLEDEQNGRWARREPIRFEEGAVERAGREAYWHGTRVRRLRARARASTERVNQALLADGPAHARAVIVEEQAARRDEFPRNPSECYRWGECAMMAFCRDGDSYSAADYTVDLGLVPDDEEVSE